MASSASPLPQRHRLSVHDYHRMGEAGILLPGTRIELIEGEIVDKVPIGSRHAAAVARLNGLFSRAAGQEALVWVQNPIRLGDYSEPEPDLALLKPRDDFYAAAHPKSGDVLLIVEVPDTSLRYDREIKIPLYARHGIPEVWLVDLEARVLTIYRRPADAGYDEERRIDSPKAFSPLCLPGAVIDLSNLL
jgi:Uma2 family endonuclease